MAPIAGSAIAGSPIAGSAIAGSGHAMPGATADLERVFADGYSRYQLVMAGTQAVRAVAYRSSLSRRGNVLNLTSAALAVGEAIRRRRASAMGADADAFCRVGVTVGSTSLLVAATPAGKDTTVSRAVLWGHLPAQWVAAGVGIFDRSARRKSARVAALLAPLALQAHRRPSSALAAMRTGAGFGSFVLVGELLTRRLRTAAARIDDTVDTLVLESEALAQRMEDERIAHSVIESAADELSSIRDLIGQDRAAAAERAAAEEALLRAWVSSDDVASLGSAPTEPDPSSNFGTRATDSLDLAVRRVEMVLRLSGTLPLVIHATWTRSRATRLVAWMATINAVWTSVELTRSEPRREWIAAGDLLTSAMATSLAAQQSWGEATEAGYPSAEALIGYVASLAPCAGTVNAEPPLARFVTASLAAILGGGALLSQGPLGIRILMGAERISMASGGSWFSHWVREVILDQTAQLTDATDQLVQARAEAAAATARRWKQYLVHDAALQVLLWVQKPDLSDDQLVDWINREIARLRMSPEREDGQRVELTGALGDLAGGFALLGIHPHLDLPDHIADLPTNVAIVVLEIVNEALTNVMKHSTDDAPVIVVTVAHHTVEVTVTNRYDGAPSTHRGTGSLALVERARTVGGMVEMWQADGHFHLGATLPVSAGGRAHLPGAAS
jgi:hypothetical protein